MKRPRSRRDGSSIAGRVDPSVERTLQVLAASVKHWREQRDLTQGELAAAAGLNRETIVRIEKGESSRVESIVRVAAALDIALTDMFAPSPGVPRLPDPRAGLLIIEQDVLAFLGRLPRRDQQLVRQLLRTAAKQRIAASGRSEDSD